MNISGLSLENAPLVVGVVTNLSTLKNIVSAPISQRPYDAVELRLDFLEDDEQLSDRWLTDCRKLEEKGMPVILTIRIEREGGRWRGEDPDRMPFFKRGLGKVSAIDIELASPLFDELRERIPAGCTSLIGSYHNFSCTPPISDLRLLVSDARKAGADIVKIVTTIKGESDSKTLTKLLEGERPFPLCIIGMGRKGADTRFSFPALGSVLTYGYIDQPTAPGQSSCQELDSHLRDGMPAYRQRKEGR